MRDVFTAFDAVNNGLNRRAVHQQHFAFAAHLAEQIFAGGFAGLDGIGHDLRVSAPGGRIDRDNDNSGGFCPLNGRFDAGLIDGGNNDQIHFLLNKGVNLRVLICQIDLRILYVKGCADFCRGLLCVPFHCREEGVGHVLHH
ncbi:Uncharacterised protein [Klebsiella pneumoniae]|nr:Uncharacterised protein [Klebsiella pneumoniae]VGB01991.1 Uncharacterised protein [Klebsiella pneumoniae]